MQRKINRDPRKFFGDSVVLGCGNSIKNILLDQIESKHHKFHSNKAYFYSLDEKENEKPDFVITLDHDTNIPELNGKFHFILMEYLPGSLFLSRDVDLLHLEDVAGKVAFDNQSIENMLASDGVIAIMGFQPLIDDKLKNKYRIWNAVTYQGPSWSRDYEDMLLLIKTPEGVDPKLVIMSLNPDAQKIIKNSYSTETNINFKYDIKQNEEYIRQKALQIISKQIARLQAESVNSLFYNTVKQNKITALLEIHKTITETYPVATMQEIVDDVERRFPDLKSGSISHIVKDYLNVIINMDRYHQEKCLHISEDASIENIQSLSPSRVRPL